MGGTLTGVCGGPEELRVPARRRATAEEVVENADVVLIGAEDVLARARTVLTAGRHVSVAVPLTPSSRAFGKLARLARASERVLHLFEPSLFVPGMRTLLGHARPGEVRDLAITATSTAPASDDPNDVVGAHHPALAQLVTVGGAVRSVADVTRGRGMITATLEMSQGFSARLALATGAGTPASELKVTTELEWTLNGGHLYCGSAMTTLTDSRSPSELAMLELKQLVEHVAAPGARAPRATLPVEALYHALKVGEALGAGVRGPLA